MNVIVLFGGVFLVSILLAAISLRDLRPGSKLKLKFEKKTRSRLSGVIRLPKG